MASDTHTDPRLSRLRAPAADAEELARVLRGPAIGAFEVATWLNGPEHVVEPHKCILILRLLSL